MKIEQQLVAPWKKIDEFSWVRWQNASKSEIVFFTSFAIDGHGYFGST